MIKELVKVATKLDELGLTKEADFLDKMIEKISTDNDIDWTGKDSGGTEIDDVDVVPEFEDNLPHRSPRRPAYDGDIADDSRSYDESDESEEFRIGKDGNTIKDPFSDRFVLVPPGTNLNKIMVLKKQMIVQNTNMRKAADNIGAIQRAISDILKYYR